MMRHHHNMWGNLEIVMSFIFVNWSLLLKKLLWKQFLSDSVWTKWNFPSLWVGRERWRADAGLHILPVARCAWASICSFNWSQMCEFLGWFSSSPISRVSEGLVTGRDLLLSYTKVNAATPCRFLLAQQTKSCHLKYLRAGINRFIPAIYAAA